MMDHILLAGGGLGAVADLFHEHLVEVTETVVDFLELLGPVLEHGLKVAALNCLGHAL
jgi:hypothetical protein